MEKPLHGYEIMQAIDRRGFAHFMRLSGGGLYYHLQKLLDSRDIEIHETEQNENYPERQVYRTTAQGKESFLKQMRKILSDVEGRKVRDPFDAVLCFGSFLKRDEIEAALAYQKNSILPIYQRLHLLYQLLKKSKQRCFAWILLVLDHSLSRLEAELKRYRSSIKRIQTDYDLNLKSIQKEAQRKLTSLSHKSDKDAI